MGIVALAMVALVLFCVGLSIAAGIVLCVIASVFLGFGMLWLSLLVALRTGRAEAGLRALLVQGGILAGLPAAALVRSLRTSCSHGPVAVGPRALAHSPGRWPVGSRRWDST